MSHDARAYRKSGVNRISGLAPLLLERTLPPMEAQAFFGVSPSL